MTLKTVHPVTDTLVPEALDPQQVVFGNPKTSALVLAESREGEEAGLWRCTPGTVKDVEVRESFLVLTGKGRVEFDDGRSVDLLPGVTVNFEGGEKTTWIIEQTILKAYWVQT